jgi:glycosyltransferase 2 family protein
MPQVSNPPKSASTGHWKWVVSIALAAALLYFSLRGVDWARVWSIIAGARWEYVVAAALLICVSSILRALRWRILLNAEANLGAWTVFRANMAGYLGNNFLPARAGELVRTLLISRRSNLSKTYVLTTALSERLMDVIALVLASSIVLMKVNPKPAWMGDLSRSMAIVATLGALTVTVVPHTGNLLTKLLGRLPLPPGLHAKLVGLSEQVLLGMRAFHDWSRFGGFVVLTAAIWTCDAFSAMVGSRALGLNLTFSVAMLLLTGLGLGSALPSTPGYVGIFQFVAVSVLVPFGISKDAALAYILITQAVGYVVVVVLGLPSFSLLREASSEMPARDGSPPASALP